MGALIVSAAYVALVVPINLWLGSDYGYLGNPAAVSEIPPFVYALGPWPQRAFILVALAPPGFIAVLLPWLIFGAGQKTEPPGNRPGSAPSVRSAHSEARALSPHAHRAITSANPGRTPAFGADGRHLWHADIALRSRAPRRGAGAAPESPGSTKV
jgi:hypothetical protein